MQGPADIFIDIEGHTYQEEQGQGCLSLAASPAFCT